MKILMSNDDGYYASGIQSLCSVLENKHEVYVAAPLANHSAGSSALSVRKNIKINNIKKNHYIIDGTPADCVHIALSCIIDSNIDLVVSGINLGANLGDDVIYSGTVAAALEGRHLKMSPIAISLVGQQNITIEKASELSSKLIESIASNKIISQNTLININIPDKDVNISNLEYTRLGRRGNPLPASNIKNTDLYKIGAAGPPRENGKGTDFHAINNNKISVSPILYDLTDSDALNKINNI
tara:strand:- start:239 stop:964 length:726 start_codon:yes stop_codon:yes gene_type:complete